jgi:formiminotetrahydrofolate cyclodeaminase
MKNLSIEQFTIETASDAPVPGGGSIAAVSGSLSAALAKMVANLTVGKKKYVEVEEEMKKISEKAEVIRVKMLDDIKRDSDSFNLVMDAFKLPKGTDEEKAARSAAIQNGLKEAASVPMEIAENAYSIMALSERVVMAGNSNAVTDGLVSAMMARTAVLSALLNVKINLDSIKDEAFVAELEEKVAVLEKKALETEKAILEASPFK